MSKQLPETIKKMTLHYSHCPNGDLHTGELMNLVCVDAACARRGLICPICRMNNHEEHKILPLKVFLDDIKKLFLENDDTDSLNNLTDYLRSLENSRKELIQILKNAAEAVAQQFQVIEKKIQDNYLSIRRNVLAQSSISTKLPNFVQALTHGGEKNSFQLQEEFQKYSELIKFENSSMVISDKAKKIVEEYSTTPKLIKATIEKQLTDLKDNFKDLLAAKAKDPAKKNTTSDSPYSFSSDHKTPEIILSNENLTVSSPSEFEQCDGLGMAYVKGGEELLEREIRLQVVKNSSNAAIFGVGVLQEDIDFAFYFQSPIANRHYYAAINGYNNFDEGSEISEMDEGELFRFEEVGEMVTISLQGSKKEVVFSKNNSSSKRVVSLANLSEEQIKKLQFFVALGENDVVKIIKS